MTMMNGKVVAITGGASGIGLALAVLLHNQGAKLAIADVNEKALTEAGPKLGGREETLVDLVDVRDDAAVNRWIEKVVNHFGRLDAAANVAGVIGKHHGVRALKYQDDEQWKLIFDINVTGLMHCMRAELKHMGTGSIVNAASIQGLEGFANYAAYSASKHAVVGLTRSVSKEAAPGIRVNAVAPGSIETPLLKQALEIPGYPISDEHPAVMNRHGSAEEVAQVFAFLLSDASSYVTGSVYSVDGGWGR